jgi:beta-lactamase superfamily II metal-dependent hydrolase
MFGPREIWDGVPVRSHEPLAALRRDASTRGTKWRAVRAGDELHMAGVTIRTLHPAVPDWERQRVRNDDSIVLDVRYGAVSVLLPGDVSADVERALIPALIPAAVRVLKVAHHGSASSTDAAFLEALRPQIAIVSCGRENPHGHPAPGVLDRLRAIGARVHRTDRDGAVIVATDGTTARVADTKTRKHENTKKEFGFELLTRFVLSCFRAFVARSSPRSRRRRTPADHPRNCGARLPHPSSIPDTHSSTRVA